MRREKWGERKELLMSQSITYHMLNIGETVLTDGYRTGSPLLIDEVASERGIRMNSEVYRPILPAHIQLNATKLTERPFAVQLDNDLKHSVKATQDLFNAKINK